MSRPRDFPAREAERQDPAPEPGPSGHETALYMFHCRRDNGSPVALEVHELRSDAEALALARSLLQEHLTCSEIEVCEGERSVGVVRRDRSWPR